MVGASCVNAVSEQFKVIIRTGGKEYGIEFEKGIKTKSLYVINNSVDIHDTGTEIRFTPDKEIWKGECFEFEQIRNRLRQLSYLNKGLTIEYFVDSTDPEGKTVKVQETFNSPNGLTDYLNDLNTGIKIDVEPEVCVKNIVYDKKNIYDEDNNLVSTKDLDVNIEFAFAYYDTFRSGLKSFVNNVATENGGDHEIGFKNGLYAAIKKYALENKLIKDGKQITSDDCSEGLQVLLSIKLKDPNFDGQAKGKLRMSSIRTAVRTTVESFFYDFLERNSTRAKLIVDKALRAAKAREAARKARDTARGLKATEVTGTVEGLSTCSSKDPEESMIFLVEGDSAGGSARQGRDRRTQAVLPVFGKVLNSSKAELTDVIKSVKSQELIKALGCGIGENFDISKLRYHKVILMADADY